MKPQWALWGKWAFVGISVAAIVMTAASEEGDGSKKKSARPDHARTPLSHKTQNQPSPSEIARLELERLTRPAPPPEAEAEIGNLFVATSWYVPPPPPPPPPPAPPPKPTAPPIPFTYLGRYEDSPAVIIMLLKGDRVYTVSEGDVIENTYRVEHVASGAVDLIYLPLNIKQSISTGNAS